MSSNTPVRVVSAIVMIIVVVIAVLLGKNFVLTMILAIGMLACDEIFTNFFRRSRKSISYLVMQMLLIVPFVFLNFIEKKSGLSSIFVNAALALNIALLYYLFFTRMTNNFILSVGKKTPYITGVIILLPIISLSEIFASDKWKELLLLLLVVNFCMDSGAWFFGKMLGKNKLWPEISPNKTIEGLVGGIFTSGFFGGLVWWAYFGQSTPTIILMFMLFGLLSQLGDLVQSKFKRQFKIKDSSNLIPGHGGVYDRIDSLIFLIPFFATALRYVTI